MSDIKLYFARGSRAFTPLWLLEELAVPYILRRLSLRRGDQKTPRFLKINPMGKVPALTDGPVTVSENPAICLYLADRYSYGVLAPAIEDPLRGAYLKWAVFSTAVMEPAIYMPEDPDPLGGGGQGWGARKRVIEVLDETLTAGPWLLGEIFSAADVMLGSLLSIALFNHRIEDPPASLLAYNERLGERPAYRRAAETTWGEGSGG
ncbi:MAG: glutathione S-transferase [Caulobacteraceae bacterium]|nr:glutathione S-transferase [Caulobacteraceae bacterium]